MVILSCSSGPMAENPSQLWHQPVQQGVSSKWDYRLDVNYLFEQYNITLRAMIDNHTPLWKVHRRHRREVLWFDAECHEAKKKVRRRQSICCHPKLPACYQFWCKAVVSFSQLLPCSRSHSGTGLCERLMDWRASLALENTEQLVDPTYYFTLPFYSLGVLCHLLAKYPGYPSIQGLEPSTDMWRQLLVSLSCPHCSAAHPSHRTTLLECLGIHLTSSAVWIQCGVALEVSVIPMRPDILTKLINASLQTGSMHCMHRRSSSTWIRLCQTIITDPSWYCHWRALLSVKSKSVNTSSPRVQSEYPNVYRALHRSVSWVS